MRSRGTSFQLLRRIRSPQVPQVGILLVFMVDVEEDHAVVGHLAAVAAMLHLPGLLAALFAPVVDEPVVAPTHIFLQSSVVHAVHPAVGIVRVVEQPVDHLLDPFVPARVTTADILQLDGEFFGGVIGESTHFGFNSSRSAVNCTVRYAYFR